MSDNAIRLQQKKMKINESLSDRLGIPGLKFLNSAQIEEFKKFYDPVRGARVVQPLSLKNHPSKTTALFLRLFRQHFTKVGL